MQVGCVRSDNERPVLNMTLFDNHKTFLSLRTKMTATSGKDGPRAGAAHIHFKAKNKKK